MGVSVRTIKRMTAAGMPSETWGMGHTRRYLAVARLWRWARARRSRMDDRQPARAAQQRRSGSTSEGEAFDG